MILEFITLNWYLFAMLAVIVLLLSFNPTAGMKKISPLQLPKLQSRESAVVLDVCAADVYKKGHIAQSINLPFDDLNNQLAKLNKYKSKPIVVVCQAGKHAAKAVAILRRNEFSDLYILEGGLIAWKKENLPLVKKSKK